MKKKRLLSALLACLLLAGCGPVRTDPADAQIWDTHPDAEKVIAYVPLDDRPDNEERVIYLAESLGYMLEMPDRDLYHTALDGQPLNENGTQYGNRGELFRWVLEQERAGCDRYVLSMDQIMSGGLVNSRAMFNHEDIICEQDGQRQTLSEYEAMGILLQTLAEDPDNRVWLLDSVMRLAPTVGYQGGALEEYNALRAYGAEPRPELTGTELTLGGVQDHYGLNAQGQLLKPEDYGLTDAWMAEYLAARGRKLDLSYTMMEMVTGIRADHIRILIGIDDSSEENSIQKNEIAYLRSLLREGDALLSGVDDLAFKAVAKLYLEEIGWSGAAASVEYFGGTEDKPACAYDYKALEEIVQEHFAFFGLEMAESSAESEFVLLVLTQPEDEANKATYYEALIQKLNQYREACLPVILIDAGNGRYGTAFHEALTKKSELGWLLSYAGFLDMAIVTGTAMSHGVARYAFLRRGTQTETTERAFLRTVADSVLKDFCYKHIVRNDILNFVRGDLAGNADNFWQPDLDRESILRRLESGMEIATEDVIRNLERSNFVSALPGTQDYAERGWGGIELTGYRFPWDRAFEIGMDIRLGEMTQPHKKVMGLYYR